MESRMSIGRESSHHSEVHYLLPEREPSLGLDLVRCESFQSLDQSTLARLLTKNYSLLVCMAPLTHQLSVLGSPSVHQYLDLDCQKLLPIVSSYSSTSILGAPSPGPLILEEWKMWCLSRPLALSILLVTTWSDRGPHPGCSLHASGCFTPLSCPPAAL